MAIKGSAWCNRFQIEWTDDNTDLEYLNDAGWRMKIMEGGVLIFEGKPSPSGAFMVVPPHTWTRLKTSSVKPMAVNTSEWADSVFIKWAGNYTHGPQPTLEKRMKIVDGGMLLFEDEAGESLVFPSHAWKSLHTAFDFTK
jgi:hypothetical protein